MARRMSRRQLEKFAEELEPGIRDAFLQAVRTTRDSASLALLTELVQAGQVDAIMEALGIAAPRYAGLAEAIRSAYLRSGLAAAAEVPELRSYRTLGRWRPSQGLRVRWNFDITNPSAEAWVRNHSSRLVTEIVRDQREAIRLVLGRGVELGRNPRSTALDIVGRMAGGRRVGGIVGLTSQQTQFVLNARAELSDPARMAAYFQRQRRDRRFDAMVRRAMQSGKPLTEEQIERIVGRYSDRMLALRGEVIARTEALTAMNAAREESYRQAIEAGDLLPENVICTWQASGDRRTRDTHAALHGQERPFGEPFRSPSGALMRFPGDTELGAPASETIQCRCTKVFRIDYAAEANRAA